MNKLKESFSYFYFQGLENAEFEFIMISESIFEELEHISKADKDIDYEDDQVQEEVNGYESSRTLFR